MDKLQPYKEIADRVFQKKSAITSNEDSLTVFFQTYGDEHPLFSLDDGSDIDPYRGILELRFLLSAFEEFDLSVNTNHERGVFGFTFRRLKSDVQIPAVFDYPDEANQRHLEYFDRVMTDFYNPSEYPEMRNINLGGFQKLNAVFQNVQKAFNGIRFSVTDHDPMEDIEDDLFEISIPFGFSTRRVFRFTDSKLDSLREAVGFSNAVTISFDNDADGFLIYLTFVVNDVRF